MEILLRSGANINEKNVRNTFLLEKQMILIEREERERERVEREERESRKRE